MISKPPVKKGMFLKRDLRINCRGVMKGAMVLRRRWVICRAERSSRMTAYEREKERAAITWQRKTRRMIITRKKNLIIKNGCQNIYSARNQ